MAFGGFGGAGGRDGFRFRWYGRAAEEGEGSVGDVLGGESELFEDALVRVGGAEPVVGDDVAVGADPAVPAQRCSRFDGQLRRSTGEDRYPVVRVLSFEELQEGHADQVGAGVMLPERLVAGYDVGGL